MKAHLLLLLSCLSGLSHFSQISLQNFYGASNADQSFSFLFHWGEDGYLLGGTEGNTKDKGNDIWLMTTDSLGQEVSSFFYGGEFNENMSHMLATNNCSWKNEDLSQPIRGAYQPFF